MGFPSAEFLPNAVLSRLTELRVSEPERAFQVAASRQRRTRLTRDGKLNLLAADHPARRVTNVGNDPLAMASRQDYLARILRVLLGGAVDGIMASMDLLEELLLLHYLIQKAGGPGFLDGKLLIPSLNRGGLAGVSWEMDDPITGPTPQTCGGWRMDGAKVLLRICDDQPGSLKTLLACAAAITESNQLKLPLFLEPLPVIHTEGGYKVIKEAEALAKIVGVASALGDSSRYLWLKLPYCKNYEIVASATTLPILLLGGEAVGDATPLLKQVAAGMQSGPNVRGAMVGRNVLYPGEEDPLVVANAVNSIVHQSLSVDEALEQAQRHRDQDFDVLSRWLS